MKRIDDKHVQRRAPKDDTPTTFEGIAFTVGDRMVFDEHGDLGPAPPRVPVEGGVTWTISAGRLDE